MRQALSNRNRELFYLVVVGLLTAIGFAAVYIADKSRISGASLTYAVFFFALRRGIFNSPITQSEARSAIMGNVAPCPLCPRSPPR